MATKKTGNGDGQTGSQASRDEGGDRTGGSGSAANPLNHHQP